MLPESYHSNTDALDISQIRIYDPSNTCHVRIVLKVVFQKQSPLIEPIGGSNILDFRHQFWSKCHEIVFWPTFWSFGMTNVIFVVVCLFLPEKRVGQKKKVAKIRGFVCFFLKNDQILTNTKTFKIRFFFLQRNTQTSPQHPFKYISNNFGVKYAYFDIFLVFL